jgi:3-hydroxy-3-methylglutaryl CoA synthase
VRGILGWGSHVPRGRLDRTTIAPVAGGGGGKGLRAVASYDEDTTTMAVEAARRALSTAPVPPSQLWFTTTTPAYLDKTNATAIHAALRLDRETAAFDANGSTRSTLAAMSAALDASVPVLVTAADVRTGRPGSAEESNGGDAAAAVLIGEESDGDLVAVLLGRASVTEEFLDRWRTPGEVASRTWEERFGETKYVPLAQEALKLAVAAAAIGIEEIDRLVIAGSHERACAAVAKAAGAKPGAAVDRLAATVGNPGAAQPLLLLATALEQADSGEIIAVLTMSDGADALVFRTTGALSRRRPAAGSVAEQIAAGLPISYGRYLAWRGLLPVEPPRRPEPARPSASAAGRNTDWKFGLSSTAGLLASQAGTVTTFTVDRLAYSPSPPVVFAVVDFDDGERLPVELTDVDAGRVRVGMRVDMTFRRLFTADGIANYFWKARPIASAPPEPGEGRDD